MRVRSVVLILVACAVLGGAAGGWAYVNRTPQLVLCAGSGPVGVTPQQIADAEAYREAVRAACDASNARQMAEATRIDPVGFGFWAGVGAVVAVVLIGWIAIAVYNGRRAYSGRRQAPSLRGRGW